MKVHVGSSTLEFDRRGAVYVPAIKTLVVAVDSDLLAQNPLFEDEKIDPMLRLMELAGSYETERVVVLASGDPSTLPADLNRLAREVHISCPNKTLEFKPFTIVEEISIGDFCFTSLPIARRGGIQFAIGAHSGWANAPFAYAILDTTIYLPYAIGLNANNRTEGELVWLAPLPDGSWEHTLTPTQSTAV